MAVGKRQALDAAPDEEQIRGQRTEAAGAVQHLPGTIESEHALCARRKNAAGNPGRAARQIQGDAGAARTNPILQLAKILFGFADLPQFDLNTRTSDAVETAYDGRIGQISPPCSTVLPLLRQLDAKTPRSPDYGRDGEPGERRSGQNQPRGIVRREPPGEQRKHHEAKAPSSCAGRGIPATQLARHSGSFLGFSRLFFNQRCARWK